MSLNDLISEGEFADARRVSLRTVRRERALCKGPPFIRLGRKIYYRKAAIDAWLLEQEQVQPRAETYGKRSGGRYG